MYDLDKIIQYASSKRIDISPADRGEWSMFCCALKVLGYGVDTFAALSSCSRQECEQCWGKEKNPSRYTDTDRARAKIIALAKERGIDVKAFSTHDQPTPKPTPREDFEGIEFEPLPPLFVESAKVEALRADVEGTALYNFLCRPFHPKAVGEVMGVYRVGGTSRFGGASPLLASAFPYINARGECVDVHMQPYGAEGHRVKGGGYTQDWLMRVEGNKERRGEWCLFGEHLLSQRPGDPVGVVESEKTALICALYCPSYVWVATGSLSNLTPRRCEGARGRRLYLFPDADGAEAWAQRAQRLRAEGFEVYLCSEIVKRRAVEPKDDLADIILRETEEDL